MPDGSEEIISSGTDGGKSFVDADPESVDRNEGGAYEPEIIHGYPVDEPRTEKFDAEGGNTSNGGPEPRRTKNGRIDGRTIRGRRSKGSSQSSGLEGVSVADAIFAIHLTLAELIAVPELSVDMDKAKSMADAVQEYGKFKAKVFNPESVALFNLCVIFGGTYAKMFFDVRNRLKAEKTARPQPTPINTPRQQTAQPATPPQQPMNTSQMSPSEIFGDMSAGLG